MDEPSPFEFHRVGVRVHGMTPGGPDAHEPCDPAWRDCRDTPLSFPKGGVFGVCGPTGHQAPPAVDQAERDNNHSPINTPPGTMDADAEALRLIDRMQSDVDSLSEDEDSNDASVIAHIEHGVRCARNAGGHRPPADTQGNGSDDGHDDIPPSAA